MRLTYLGKMQGRLIVQFVKLGLLFGEKNAGGTNAATAHIATMFRSVAQNVERIIRGGTVSCIGMIQNICAPMVNVLFRRKHARNVKMVTLSRGKTNMGDLSLAALIIALKDANILRKNLFHRCFENLARVISIF